MKGQNTVTFSLLEFLFHSFKDFCSFQYKINFSIHFILFVPLIQGWEFAHRFFERIARILQKNERPELLAHVCSFLVSNLSDLLTSLTKNEGMRESLIFLSKKTYIKNTKK